MPGPGILTGGNTSLFRTNPNEANAVARTGIFAAHPGATPKYARNRGKRDAEYSDTIARLFIELPPTLNIEDFLSSLPEASRELGRVLAVGGSTAGSGGTGFIDFVLQSAQESFNEKTQIVNTLTDNYVAFYAGQEAPAFQYSGIVLNTYQDDQRVWLLRLYQDILRGSKLAQRKLIASLRYDSFVVRGYLEALMLNLQSSMQMGGSFTFVMRVKDMSIHTPSLSLPTISKNLSQGVIPTQIITDIASDSARAASLTVDEPPTAVRKPASQTREDEIAAVQRLSIMSNTPAQEHIAELTSRTKNLNVDNADAGTSIPFKQNDLLAASNNPTNDGTGLSLSNVRSSGPTFNNTVRDKLLDPAFFQTSTSFAASIEDIVISPGGSSSVQPPAILKKVPSRTRGSTRPTTQR